MSKKSLLEEGSVRQFMKLANLTPLSDNFVSETYVKEEEEVNEEVVDEDVTEEVVKEEFEEEEAELSAEMPPEPELTAEPEMDMAEEPPAAGGDIAGLVKAIADAISAHTGVEVAVSGEEGEAGEEAAIEEPGEEAEAEAGEMEFAAEEDEALADEAPAMRDYEESLNLDAIVAEVTKRVKKRLSKSKK
jgi:hypothetical protein